MGAAPTKIYEIDKTDLKILGILIQDAKRPYTEVAKKVFVSQGTVCCAWLLCANQRSKDAALSIDFKPKSNPSTPMSSSMS